MVGQTLWRLHESGVVMPTRDGLARQCIAARCRRDGSQWSGLRVNNV